jgi:hypothetical protein
MKQIILESQTPARRLCVGKLVLLWGCYGYAMLLLWQIAAGRPWAQAAAWALALVAGLALAFATEGV